MDETLREKPGEGIGVAAPRRPERRQHQRYGITLDAQLVAGSTAIAVTVVDISAGGARLWYDPQIGTEILGRHWMIEISNLGQYPCHLIWRTHDSCGIEFDLSPAEQRQLKTRLPIWRAERRI